MLTKSKENFHVSHEINAKKTSLVSILKTFLFIIPIVLLTFQFIFVGKIVNLYVSPFKSGTVILVLLLSTQLPGLSIYRRMLGLELFPVMFSIITSISILDPLVNLLFISFAQSDLIDYTTIGFAMMIIGTNILFLIVFSIVCWIYRKKLYSIFKTMMISSALAFAAQFIVLMTTSLPKDVILISNKTFSAEQLAILVIGVVCFVLMAAAISIFIKLQTRKISIFNRLSRYSLAGIITVPISLIGVGTFRTSLKGVSHTGFSDFISFHDASTIITMSFVFLIFLCTLLIIVAHLKYNVVPSTIKFLALVLTLMALIGSSLVYVFTDSEILAGMSLIFIGCASVISHISLSYLRGLCQNEIKLSVMIDANYFLSLLMMGVYTMVILLRYDVMVSQKLFSPNLLFIVVQVGVVSLLMMFFMKERSQTLIGERGV